MSILDLEPPDLGLVASEVRILVQQVAGLIFLAATFLSVPAFLSFTVLALMVEGSIASGKKADTFALGETPVAFSAGLTFVTDGGVPSFTVVGTANSEVSRVDAFVAVAVIAGPRGQRLQ